jgi:hypothetical protein
MAFCTIVEWDSTVDFSRLTAPKQNARSDDELPSGCLSRVVGQLSTGTCVIEIWQTGEDAKRFGESSAAEISASEIPPPTRVAGFETDVYKTR